MRGTRACAMPRATLLGRRGAQETPRKAMRHVAADVKYLTEIEKSAISVQAPEHPEYH
jgi:hypothetical protein